MHAILFLLLTLVVVWKTRKIIHAISNDAIKRKMTNLASFGTATALLAYFLWNIDVHLCPMVTRMKHAVGYPWGILLELHGWWHVLTAIAAYTFIAMIEFLTDEDHDESHGRGFCWPAKSVLEDAARKQKADGGTLNGSVHTNGSTKRR